MNSGVKRTFPPTDQFSPRMEFCN